MDVVDTSVLILGIQALQSSSGPISEGLQARCAAYVETMKYEDGAPSFAVPAIVLAELLAGLDHQQRTNARDVLERFIVLPFDAVAAAQTGDITRGALANRGDNGVPRQCTKADAMIAGTALAQGASRIVTCNVQHFKFVEDRIQVLAPPSFSRQQTLELLAEDEES